MKKASQLKQLLQKANQPPVEGPSGPNQKASELKQLLQSQSKSDLTTEGTENAEVKKRAVNG